MFLGKYEHKLDNKNRVSIPAKFKVLFGGKEIYTLKGFEDCIMCCSKKYFYDWVNKINQQTDSSDILKTDENLRALKRKFYDGAETYILDSASRILISENIKKMADLKNKILWVGSGEYCEIWNPEKYKKYLEKTGSIESLSKKIKN